MGEVMQFGTPNQHHPLDVCQCGDYRRQHADGTGPCVLNSLGHGAPGYRCNEFRIFEYAPPGTPTDG